MNPIVRLEWAASLMPHVSDRAARIALAIAWRCNAKDGHTWASYATLAKDTGICRRSMIRAAAELEDLGCLRVIRRDHRTCLFFPQLVSSQTPPSVQPDTLTKKLTKKQEREGQMNNLTAPDLVLLGAIASPANYSQWQKLLDMYTPAVVVRVLRHMAAQGEKAWLAEVAQYCLRIQQQQDKQDENIIYE